MIMLYDFTTTNLAAVLAACSPTAKFYLAANTVTVLVNDCN